LEAPLGGLIIGGPWRPYNWRPVEALYIIGGPWKPHKALKSGKHISSQSGRQPVWQGKKYEKILENIKT
jgi:hypothetical protein